MAAKHKKPRRARAKVKPRARKVSKAPEEHPGKKAYESLKRQNKIYVDKRVDGASKVVAYYLSGRGGTSRAAAMSSACKLEGIPKVRAAIEYRAALAVERANYTSAEWIRDTAELVRGRAQDLEPWVDGRAKYLTEIPASACAGITSLEYDPSTGKRKIRVTPRRDALRLLQGPLKLVTENVELRGSKEAPLLPSTLPDEIAAKIMESLRSGGKLPGEGGDEAIDRDLAVSSEESDS